MFFAMINGHTENIGWQQITGKLDTLVARSDDGRQCVSQRGFANARQIFNQKVTARQQAARIDFATSNLRGAPFELFCAGGKIDATICMGPVAGTAANITALSYNGNLDLGLFIDPVAIEDPAGYRACVEAAFSDLLALAEEPVKKRKTAKKAPGKKTPKKKASAKTAAG